MNCPHQTDGEYNDIREAIPELLGMGQTLIEALQSYQEQVSEHPPARPEVGCLYKTYNGSTVCVTDAVYNSTRPVMLVPIGGSGGPVFDAIQKQVEQMLNAPKPQPEASPDEEPSAFVVVVLKGGHGLDDVNGEKPGCAYYVNITGSVKGLRRQNPQNPRHNGLVMLQLGLIGMSLKEKAGTV